MKKEEKNKEQEIKREKEIKKIDREEREDIYDDADVPREYVDNSVNKVHANEKYYQHDLSDKNSKDSKNAIGKIVTAIRFISNSLIRRPFLPNKGEIVEVKNIEDSSNIGVTVQYAKPRVATEEIKKVEKTIEYDLEKDKKDFDFLLKKGNASKPSDLIGQQVPIHFRNRSDDFEVKLYANPKGYFGKFLYYISRLKYKLKIFEARKSGEKERIEYNRNLSIIIFIIFFGFGFISSGTAGSILYAFGVLFFVIYLLSVVVSLRFALGELLFVDTDEREYIEKIIKK